MKKKDSMAVGLYDFVVRYLKGRVVVTLRVVSVLLGLGVSIFVYRVFLRDSQLGFINLLVRLPQFHRDDIRVFALLITPIVGGLLIGYIIGYIKYHQNMLMEQEQLLREIIRKKNFVLKSLEESSEEYDPDQKEQREGTVLLLSSAQRTLELQLHKTSKI